MKPTDRSAKIGAWSDYVVGVLRELQHLGLEPAPFVLTLRGDVPFGAGLSSSASVEVASAMALLGHLGKKLPLREIARLSQRAENQYVGSPCGIMDQFASVAAVRGHALLLHTRTLEYEILPMNTGDLAKCRVVVLNSGVRHSITGGGAYEDRRRAAEDGERVLKDRFGVRDLGEIDRQHLEACQDAMGHDAFKRCRHIVTENDRTLRAASAMRAGDPVRLGEAMFASHVSQRDDFECSVPEIDFLVDAAMQQPGCFGSRLTGGGFGGCTVSLVKAEDVENFVHAVTAAYASRFGYQAQAFVCEASDGAAARHPEVVD